MLPCICLMSVLIVSERACACDLSLVYAAYWPSRYDDGARRILFCTPLLREGEAASTGTTRVCLPTTAPSLFFDSFFPKRSESMLKPGAARKLEASALRPECNEDCGCTCSQNFKCNRVHPLPYGRNAQLETCLVSYCWLERSRDELSY